jgi:diguanylate cyclase (GGDEF)-like protein/PAS domain S-box-containing protein
MDARLERSADGKALFYEGFVMDVTERKRVEEALLESENRFHSLYDNTTIGIYRTTPDGRILLTNPAGIRMLGYNSFEEISERNLEEDGFGPNYERNQFHDRMKREGIIIGLETVWKRKDGSAIYIRENATAIKDSNGNIIYYDGTFENITERKQAEIERQALLEIMQGILMDDQHEFFKLIHRSIARVIAAENFFIVLYNKTTERFEEVYSVDKYDVSMPPSRLEKSITSYVFRTGEPLLLDPQRFDDLLARNEVELVGTRPVCWLGAPLKTPSDIIGVIAAQDYENLNSYSDRDKDFLAFISAQIALGIERKYAQDELVAAKESLRLANLGLQQALTREQRISRTDSLTDAHNRRYFFEIADHQFAVAKRYGKPISMIMFDIDHFKQFNDSYGHQVGDEILRQVTQIAGRQLRESDILVRYGGEEFAILLPNNTMRESAVVAERIRERIADYKMDVKGAMVSITISIGVAEILSSTQTLDQLVQQVDSAMYAAKNAGRNCVVLYSS